MGGGGQGWHTWPFNEHKNLHFDIEQDIYMSLENDEDGGNNLKLDC